MVTVVARTLTGVECAMTVIRIPAKLLSDGAPTMWAELMDELREIHLGLNRSVEPARPRRPAAGGL